jgi:transcription elongation factor GreA
MSNLPITKNGYANIEAEIKELKTVQRPAIIKAIAEAREHGDLKENAEYHSARDKQSFIEGRVLELEDKVARALIVDPTKLSGDIVKFGATVSLLDLDNDEEFTYQIVSEYEANFKKGLISNTSPIARGLMGKALGDEAIIQTPKGQKSYEITKVEFK